MEVLKNVLIKECNGPDKVFVVDNLPKELLYQRVTKMLYDWKLDRDLPDFVDGEDGKRRFTGAKVDALLEGIERSQTGDGGYVFFTGINSSKEALERIDSFIKDTLPPLSVIPKRIFYASQPGNLTSGPKPIDQLPRVVLPEPATSPKVEESVPSAPEPTFSQASAPTLVKKRGPGRWPKKDPVTV